MAFAEVVAQALAMLQRRGRVTRQGRKGGGREARSTRTGTSLPLGHHAPAGSAHIACDQHAKIRRGPRGHTAPVKAPAVLGGDEVWLRLWPCCGEERDHRRRECPDPVDGALADRRLGGGAHLHCLPFRSASACRPRACTHKRKQVLCQEADWGRSFSRVRGGASVHEEAHASRSRSFPQGGFL